MLLRSWSHNCFFMPNRVPHRRYTMRNAPQLRIVLNLSHFGRQNSNTMHIAFTVLSVIVNNWILSQIDVISHKERQNVPNFNLINSRFSKFL